MAVAEPAALPTVPGAFLLVTAPTARCGTTVLQRLLCSSPRGLVFGEATGAALIEHARALAGRAKLLEQTAGHRQDLARALAGEQFWYPHLLGDAPGFVELYRSALERCLRFHAELARAHGRPLWGAKLPTVPVAALHTLRSVCPDARIVYVVRDLLAAARSAKARCFWRTPAELERFAVSWREGVIAIEELRNDPRVLVLDHEAIARRDPTLLERLEAFTGMDGLDPGVLGARVNTWQAEAPGQFVAPSDLTEEELAVLERVVRFALAPGPGELAPAARR